MGRVRLENSKNLPTSTKPNFYTGLKLTSNAHLDGREAPEGVLVKALSALRRAHSARRGFYFSFTCTVSTMGFGVAVANGAPERRPSRAAAAERT